MKKSSLLIGVVVIAAGIYYFGPSLLSSAVKKVIHKYGSEVIGTEVNLDGFSLHPTSGEASISKLTIANPKNYKMPYLFELNNINIKVNVKSLTSDTIIIDDITIDKPAITYEMLSLTQNNIKEIQNNINSYMSKSSSEEKADTSAKTDSSDQSAGKKVIIKHLAINDTILSTAAGNENVSITLPNITMNNIGDTNKDNESNIPQIIAKVMNKILTTATQNIVSQKLGDLKGVAEENLNSVVGGVKDRVKELGIFGK